MEPNKSSGNAVTVDRLPLDEASADEASDHRPTRTKGPDPRSAAEQDPSARGTPSVTVPLGKIYESDAADRDDSHEAPPADELLLDDELQQTAGRSSTPSSEEQLSDDADDLTSYMESFLARMNCNPAHAPSREQKQTQPQAAEPQQKQKQEEENPPGREYAGPKAAPEDKDKLANMRELANANTKESLSHHAASIAGRTRRALVVAAGTTAISMLLASRAESTSSLTFAGSVVLLVIAAVAARQYFQGLAKLHPANS